MKMKIALDAGAKMPTRAHPYDAGLDLYSPIKCVVPCGEIRGFDEVEVGSITIDTGVHVEIPEGYVGFIKSKSGLNVKHGLTADGVIDAHYTGSITVKLYNHNPCEHYIMEGNKIAQLVILKCELPELELLDHLEDTDRGAGGFGSTGL